MDGSSDPLAPLVDEYLARRRRGENPSVEEFVARCPDRAEEFRDLISTLRLLEDVAPGPGGEPPPPRQLGDYRILREIGRGGMGVVYEAEQIPLGRHVALKVLPFHRLLDPVRLERFRREAQAAARLRHPHIVPVFGVGEHEGTHFFAMQYVIGQGLDAVIAEIRRLSVGAPTTARLPGQSSTGGKGQYFASVARIGIDVASALEHAHAEGVLHRDIKPSNLLLDSQGTVWVTDFGLAKADEADGMTRTGDIVGTVGYMAPERFQGWADPRSDVYGLGLVLYEMLAMNPAFADSDINRLIKKVVEEDPQRPRAADRRVPVDLETIVLKAIAKDPAHRYQTAAQLRQDLERFVRAEPIHARRSGTWERARKWARRRPAAAALVVVSVVAVLLLLGGSIWYGGKVRVALGVAEGERNAKERALVRARALALATASENVQARDPELALLLARDAARQASMPETTARLRDALRGPAEVARFESPAFFVLGGRRIGSAKGLWDLEGRQIATLEGPAEDVLQGSTAEHLAATGADGSVLVLDSEGREIGRLRCDAAIRLVCFSPEGGTLAVATEDGACRLWDVGARKERVVLRHPGGLEDVSFSPTGKLIVTSRADGTASVHDLDGRVILGLGREGEGILRADFSPDSRLLLVRRWPKAEFETPGAQAGLLEKADLALPQSARLWDIGRGTAIVLDAESGILGASFSSADDLVLMSTTEGAAVWDTSGRPVATIPGCRSARFLGGHYLCETGGIFSKSFLCNRSGERVADLPGSVWPSPAGDRLLAYDAGFLGPGDNFVRVLAADGQEVAVLRGHEAEIRWAWFSDSGARIVTVAADRTARVWDAAGAAVAVLRHDADVEDAVLSPAGDHVLARTADGISHLWTVGESGRSLMRIGNAGHLPIADFGPAGRVVVLAEADERGVLLYDGQGRVELQVQGALCPLNPRGAFSPEGDALLVAGAGVRLVGFDGGVRGTYGSADMTFKCALFSPSGAEILASSESGRCFLWDRSGRELAVLRAPGPVFAPAFSPDGELIVTAGCEGAARLFRRDGVELSALHPGDGKNHGMITAAFHPERALLLAVSARVEMFEPLQSLFRDAEVSLWDIADPRRPKRKWSRPGFLAATFSPSGTQVLTPSPDNAARLFDLDGDEVFVLTGHSGLVVHACFSPSGDRIVTTSMDGTARLWDAQGRLLEVLRGQSGPVIWAAFSPSGREVVTTSYDGTVRIRTVYVGDILDLASRRFLRDFTPEERAHYAELLIPAEGR